MIKNRLSLLIGFSLLLFNPITFSEFWTQPIRINFYASLVLIYLSSLIALLASTYQFNSKRLLKYAFVCGVSLALAWNTREESIWLIPVLLPFFLLTLLRIKDNEKIPTLSSWFLIIAIPVICCYSIATVNNNKYGVNYISEFKGTHFSRALNAIFSLNTENDGKPYRYFSKTTIEKLQKISDSTRLLKKGIIKSNGKYRRLYIVKGDLTSWAIRNAMVKVGYYRDAARTEQAYKKIADDIENYCLTQESACRKTYIPGLIVKPSALKNISSITIKGLLNLIDFSYFPPALERNKLKRGDKEFQYTH